MTKKCKVCGKELPEGYENFCSSECYHASDGVLNE